MRRRRGLGKRHGEHRGGQHAGVQAGPATRGEGGEERLKAEVVSRKEPLSQR